MYRLPFIIVLIFGSFGLQAQSPHGENLTLDCIACHTTEGWEIDDSFWEFSEDIKEIGADSIAKFNHFDTEFPLEGMHEQVDCKMCHTALIFDEADTDCISCHLDVHQSTFGNDCVRCHDTEDWLVDAIPEIHEQNGFPLSGVHADVSCIECHVDESQLQFQNTGNECVNCHLDDYNATTNPNHMMSGFSLDCTECHTTIVDGWRTENDHDALYFPIYSGTHQGEWSDCIDCHINPDDFSIFSCINCHIKSETDDEHDGVPGYVYEDNACLICHPTGEEGEGFDHNRTNFPLTGAHINVDCILCHADGYSGTSTECVDCHQMDFNETKNPDHLAAGISNDCIQCHTTDPGWKPATFDIHDDYYPLLGAHASIANECAKCHNGDYQNTPNTCVGCHLDDYNDADNPDHLAAGIGKDCVQCHTTDPGWKPATFDIHDDYYPLLGAHASIANECAKCHNGDYQNTPNTCIGCHLDDYNDADDPDHQAANFPEDCTQCHNLNDWEPADFDHDAKYFPIYSGNHKNEWNKCSECHLNNNYASFSCIDCHEHNDPNDLADEHDDVNGYVYESNACFECHPNGD